MLTYHLVQAVIKASGGITGKGKEFWTVVANNMDEKISWDAARKRFDKFKPETEYENAAGEAERTVIKTAATPRKRSPAKPKAAKAAGKSKGKKEVAEDGDTEGGSQEGDDVEDVAIIKGENDSQEGEDGSPGSYSGTPFLLSQTLP